MGTVARRVPGIAGVEHDQLVVGGQAVGDGGRDRRGNGSQRRREQKNTNTTTDESKRSARPGPGLMKTAFDRHEAPLAKRVRPANRGMRSYALRLPRRRLCRSYA